MGFFDGLIGAIQTGVQQAQTTVTNFIQPVAAPVQQATQQVVNQYVAPAAQQVQQGVSNAGNYVDQGIQNISQGGQSFISRPMETIGITLAANPIVGPGLVNLANPQNIATPQPQPVTFKEQFISGFQQSVRMTPIIGLPMGITLDSAVALAQGKPQNLPFSQVTESLFAQKPTGISPEQYNQNLGNYNANLTAYNTNLAKYQAGGSTDTGMFAALTARQATLNNEFQSVQAQQKTVTPTPSFLDRVGEVYEGLNRGLAPYTTDTFGIGRALEKSPNVDLKQYGDTSGVPYSEGVNFAKGTVVGVTQHPLDLVATYYGGEALGVVSGLGGRGVAWAASRGTVGESGMQALKQGQILTATGRALSTPLASDVTTLIKAGVGTYIIGESIVNIADQPTSYGKGEAFGRTTLQFTGFTAGMINTPVRAIEGEVPGRFTNFITGMNQVKIGTPDNPSAMRNFFSGSRDYSPLQKVGMDVRAYATSFEVPTEMRSTYRDIPKAYREIRFQDPQPGITETTPSTGFKEPDISIASTIGTERAPAVRAAIGEQEGNVIYGSVMMEGQKTGLKTGELIRSSGTVHDVDLKVPDPAKLEAALAARGETGAGMDIKSFSSEPKHPLAQGNQGPPDDGVRRIGILSRIFGEAIPNEQGYKLPFREEVRFAGKDYEGVLNQEQINIQFARKSQALMQDMVPAEGKIGNVDARPMDEQFRIPKEFYDFQSLGRDITAGTQAAKLQAGGNVPIGTETPAIKIFNRMEEKIWHFDFMPKEDNPIIGAKAGVRFTKDVSFGEIKANTEAAIRAAKVEGKPLPKQIRATAEEDIIDLNRPYTPGVSRSVTSGIQRAPLASSATISSASPMIASAFPTTLPGMPSSGSPSGNQRTQSMPSVASLSPSEVSRATSPMGASSGASSPSIMSVMGVFASPSPSSGSRGSASPSPTGSPSASPFTSPSPSPSMFASPSPSPFPSPSLSPSPSPTPSPFPSFSPFPSIPPSPGPSPSPSPSPSPYPSTPPVTPPWSPLPPIIPTPPIVPGMWGGMNSPGPFQRKRRAAFKETFNMGLDFSIKKPSKIKGKSFTSPKKTKAVKTTKRKK